MPRPSWASAAVGAAALAAVLCGCAGGEEVSADATLRVYVSLPLRGAAGADGRDAADGARLALDDAGSEAGGIAVEARFLDDTEGTDADARWSAATVAANARTATQDSTTIAYLGDFEPGATRTSLPITNSARVLQVSPASAASDLVAEFPGSDEVPDTQPSGERSFGRVIPGDEAQAAAAAGWVERMGIRRVSTVSDAGDYGDQVVGAFKDALERASISKFGQLLFFGGELPGIPASLAQSFKGTLMVTDAQLTPEAIGLAQPHTLATSAALDPSQLPPAGQDFASRFEAEYGRAPGRYAAYGYESMALICDSIDRASDPGDRGSVIEAFFATSDRDSTLGTYSIDALGETTLDRMTGYEIDGGRIKAVAELGSG